MTGRVLCVAYALGTVGAVPTYSPSRNACVPSVDGFDDATSSLLARDLYKVWPTTKGMGDERGRSWQNGRSVAGHPVKDYEHAHKPKHDRAGHRSHYSDHLMKNERAAHAFQHADQFVRSGRRANGFHYSDQVGRRERTAAEHHASGRRMRNTEKTETNHDFSSLLVAQTSGLGPHRSHGHGHRAHRNKWSPEWEKKGYQKCQKRWGEEFLCKGQCCGDHCIPKGGKCCMGKNGKAFGCGKGSACCGHMCMAKGSFCCSRKGHQYPVARKMDCPKEKHHHKHKDHGHKRHGHHGHGHREQLANHGRQESLGKSMHDKNDAHVKEEPVNRRGGDGGTARQRHHDML